MVDSAKSSWENKNRSLTLVSSRRVKSYKKPTGLFKP